MTGPNIRTDLGEPRLFFLARVDDPTGISGSGRVADGVLWPDGQATIHWRTTMATTDHANSVHVVEALHGHGGATTIVWLDGPTMNSLAQRRCNLHMVHGGHPWNRTCGTSIYEYWCEGEEL